MLKFKPNSTVLFQGDSITDMGRGRTEDPNHLYGHGYVYHIVSKYTAEHPEDKITFYNRGVSGNTSKQILDRWEEDTIALKPDVLSLLCPVNDVGASSGCRTTAQTREAVTEMIERSFEMNPDLQLILCEPFMYLDMKTPRHEGVVLSVSLPEKQEVIRECAKKYNAIFVPFQKMFDDLAAKTGDEAYWIWDGIHPTAAGHYHMAQQWTKIVSEHLK